MTTGEEMNVNGIIRVLRFVNLLGAAILAGGQVFVLAVIIPVKRHLPAGQSVRVHQTMLDELPDRYLRPAGAISMVAAALTLLLQPDRSRVGTLFTLLGLLSGAGVVVTSEQFNKPTNRLLRGWSTDSPPETYPALRDRWDAVHAARTACGLLALAWYIAANLVPDARDEAGRAGPGVTAAGGARCAPAGPGRRSATCA